MLLGAALLLASCEKPGEVAGGGACPTPERPYLHLDNADCLAQIPPPRISDVVIAPFGGKVPIEITFRAAAEPPYPELAAGMRLIWDVDGTPGQDAEVGADEPLVFRYDNCGNVPVSVIAVDRFGRASAVNERVLINRCNVPPQITLFVAGKTGAPNDPPIGSVGESIRFTFQAVDPDADDPDLEPANGIRNFQIDWEGDGTFDETFDGILQLLPLDRPYPRVGIFRPILRAYDDEGDYGEAGPLLVSIFAQSVARGRLRVDGRATAVAPTPDEAGRAAATSIAYGWGVAGWGLAERSGAERLRSERIFQRNYQPGSSEDDLRDLAWLPEVGMLTANANQGVALWYRGGAAAWNWSAIRRYACLAPSTAQWLRLDSATLATGGRVTTLVTGGGSLQIRRGPYLQDGDLANPDWCGLATRFGALSGGGNASLAAPVPLAGTLLARDAAVAGRYVFAIADDGTTGGALMTWRIDGSPLPTTATPLCAGTPSACIVDTGRRPTALAVDAGGRVSQIVDGALDADSLRLPRAVTSAAGATLAIGATTRPVGSGWAFEGGAPFTAITLDPTPLAEWQAAGHAVLSAEVEPLLALGWSDGEVALRPWSDGGSAPAFGTATTAQTTRRPDRLAIAGHVLAWADATTPRLAVEATAPTGLRQARGVYAAPLTDLARWAQLRPDDWALREADTVWAGPRDLATDGATIWAAEDERGVRGIDLTGFVPAVWAAAPTAWDDGAGHARRLEVHGRVGDTRPSAEPAQPRRGTMDADPEAGEAWLAMGAAGLARVVVRETWDGGTLAAAIGEIEGIWPTSAPARDLALLPADGAGDTRIVVGEGRCGRTACVPADGRLTTFAPDQPSPVSSLALTPAEGWTVHLSGSRSLDSGDGWRSILLLGRQVPAGTTSWDVRGALADGSLGSTVWTVPSALTTNLYDLQPPMLANLSPAGGRERSLFINAGSGGFDRLCAEPFWGGTCGAAGTDLGVRGQPLPMVSGGRRFAVHVENDFTFTFRSTDLNEVLPVIWHPCRDLPDEERELCAVGFKVYDAWPADPYWLVSTSHALFVVDVTDPGRPFVVTRQLQCNRIAATTPGVTCPLADWDVVTGWVHEGIGGVRAVLRHKPGQAVQIIDVPDLFTPAP